MTTQPTEGDIVRKEVAKISEPQVIWEARDKTAEDLVFACARGELPFSGPDSLFTEFHKRGWSTRYLYEAVINAEFAIGKRK